MKSVRSTLFSAGRLSYKRRSIGSLNARQCQLGLDCFSEMRASALELCVLAVSAGHHLPDQQNVRVVQRRAAGRGRGSAARVLGTCLDQCYIRQVGRAPSAHVRTLSAPPLAWEVAGLAGQAKQRWKRRWKQRWTQRWKRRQYRCASHLYCVVTLIGWRPSPGELWPATRALLNIQGQPARRSTCHSQRATVNAHARACLSDTRGVPRPPRLHKHPNASEEASSSGTRRRALPRAPPPSHS